MASENDEQYERFIEDFRSRLQHHIKVEQVLDYLHLIGADEKEQIRRKARAEGDLSAANVLIDAVVRKPHPTGWFRAFVDALVHSGCEYAADCMQENLREPRVDAENDCCVRLIQILYPSLIGMKTSEVCVPCFSQGLITQEDFEIVSKLTLFVHKVVLLSQDLSFRLGSEDGREMNNNMFSLLRHLLMSDCFILFRTEKVFYVHLYTRCNPIRPIASI